MPTLAAVILALTLPPAASPLPPGYVGPPGARPAAHAQNIEAFAAPDIEKTVPTAIVALNGRQLKDPYFRPLANELADALQRQGFNVVQHSDPFRNVITLEYSINQDTNGDLPGQSTRNPSVQIGNGLAHFPVYRRLTVTSYAVGDRAHAQVLWRTVMAEDGFDNNVGRMIPPLVEAGSKYYGSGLTGLAAADCDDFDHTNGPSISARPCAEVSAQLRSSVVRRPQVTVGPLSSPTPSVSAPPGR